MSGIGVFSGTAVLCLALSTQVMAQDVGFDLEADISRVKRDIARIEQERTTVRTRAEQDRAGFEEYRTRTDARMKAIRAETDSVRGESRLQVLRNDSLTVIVSASKSALRETALRQEALRIALVGAVDTLSVVARRVPPLVAQQALSAVDLLRADLAATRIDNAEGINRYARLVAEMENQIFDIQIMQGPSPVPELGATAYRLRIGGVFEAAVDEKGERAAVWNADVGWQRMDDAASEVLRAVRIREGKDLPAVVLLPLVVPASKGETP